MKTTVFYGVLGAFALLVSGCNQSKMMGHVSGVFEAKEVIVSTELGGEVVDWEVTEGKVVGMGEVMGVIDSVQLSLKREQLEIAARASATRKQDIGIQLAALEEQIATQRRELQRIDNLLQTGSATTKQRDDAQAQLQVSVRQLEAQRTSLRNANEGVAHEMDSWDVQIRQVNDQLRRCYVKSPIDGRILIKYIEQGELSVPGKPLFKVADTDQMFLRAYVPAPLLTLVKLGQKATVYADLGESQRAEYEGVVTWVSDKAEFTPKTIQTRDERANLVYAVKVSVKNDGNIKIGMYGEVKF